VELRRAVLLTKAVKNRGGCKIEQKVANLKAGLGQEKLPTLNGKDAKEKKHKSQQQKAWCKKKVTEG